ncbi:MAG: glycosyltransferase family 4 protein [Aerococcus sp.]|nr:glycosyltransferase family 4 protein [Aerococcus sp.]
MRRMRIGIFTDTYFPQVSGVATSIQTLKRELECQGHKVYIFTTTDPDATLEPDVYRFESIPFIFFKERRVAVATFSAVMRCVRNLDLDVVHTQTEFGMGIAGLHVARELQIPVIHTYHTWYEKYLHYVLNGHVVTKGMVQYLSRVFCNRCDAVISPSAMIADVLREYGVTKPITVIPTGVALPDTIAKPKLMALRQRLGLSADDFVEVSVNRIAEEKNLDTLIKAHAALQYEMPNAKLVLVGDGPEREALEELVALNELGDTVLFTGMIPHEEVAKYYQMADVYVNLSLTETQGVTFIEAVANGLPVVAIANDYLENLETIGHFGELIDSTAEYPDAIKQVYHHRERYTEAVGALKQAISAETFACAVLERYEAAKAQHLPVKRRRLPHL